MVTVIFSSSFLSSSHWSLTSISINSLQFLLPFSVVHHSPPTLSRFLLRQSSRHILRLPRLLFTSTFWAFALLANVLSLILSTVPPNFIASNISTQKQQFHNGAFVRICVVCLYVSCSSLFHSNFVLVLLSLTSAFYQCACGLKCHCTIIILDVNITQHMTHEKPSKVLQS